MQVPWCYVDAACSAAGEVRSLGMRHPALTLTLTLALALALTLTLALALTLSRWAASACVTRSARPGTRARREGGVRSGPMMEGGLRGRVGVSVGGKVIRGRRRPLWPRAALARSRRAAVRGKVGGALQPEPEPEPEPKPEA